MKPVDQTRFGRPGGNCFQAALASILEMPLEQVPDFCNMKRTDWESALNEWLYDYGLFAMHVDLAKSEAVCLEWLTDNCLALAAVPSKTGSGGLHSVVYHKGRVIHDPHPDREHLDSKPRSLDVFVAIDPAKLTKEASDA